ncbi:MAG TPA: permease prefix domain 1-containing protein [Pyrinomonadaceae bacterium]|nr:permease prefix domain 1-containing protein [Pyrinomonadaceae bacterium]
MSLIKATNRFLHAWRYPDDIAREVEAELSFHIEMRTRSNIGAGMDPDEARLAARKSFGDFDEVKTECCEISRSLPFNSTVLKMGVYLILAVLAGGTALVTVNLPHHNLSGVLWQLVAIAVLARAFIVGRRSISTRQFPIGIFKIKRERFHNDKVFSSDVSEKYGVGIAAHDEQGRTPVERMFK